MAKNDVQKWWLVELLVFITNLNKKEDETKEENFFVLKWSILPSMPWGTYIYFAVFYIQVSMRICAQ